MRTIATLFSVSFLLATSSYVCAAPAYHPSAPSRPATETGNVLLRGYEQDGLLLQDDMQAGVLTIKADPATLHVDGASGSADLYRQTVKDVLSAAATYAYLYFGQNPEAAKLSVVADIQEEGAGPASMNVGDDKQEAPALTIEITRPSFPISADTKPDAYSAQTIGMILDNVDTSKMTMATWLQNALKGQAQPPAQ
ncbi:hypothetical protein GOB86_13085 [Acetobacter lambici]|uniref:Uncharacterized protein n=1 Tax=Acetobacter lambici TaxID=1332824 RepID=A0ABT1F3Q1_9PROT|nr:hypothetical protein [Acetobacter lambici]MCP1243736.1 hypothetical protein [Acetobacter lambici]MCP1259832.1 hypothetical protein [Acetobacter lambici]NHO57973.1 hypothetical protein [Acetobacter lambici]